MQPYVDRQRDIIVFPPRWSLDDKDQWVKDNKDQIPKSVLEKYNQFRVRRRIITGTGLLLVAAALGVGGRIFLKGSNKYRIGNPGTFYGASENVAAYQLPDGRLHFYVTDYDSLEHKVIQSAVWHGDSSKVRKDVTLVSKLEIPPDFVHEAEKGKPSEVEATDPSLYEQEIDVSSLVYNMYGERGRGDWKQWEGKQSTLRSASQELVVEDSKIFYKAGPNLALIEANNPITRLSLRFAAEHPELVRIGDVYGRITETFPYRGVRSKERKLFAFQADDVVLDYK